MTEKDISQNSDSASYFSFDEVDDNLHQYCIYVGDQEISWGCQSNASSSHSTSEFLLLKEVAPVQFIQRPNWIYEECSQHAENFISNNFKENFTLPIYDEQEGNVQKEGHSHFSYEKCNQYADNYVNDIFSNMPTYDEYDDDHLDSAPNFLEGDEDSQMDVSFCF